MPWTAPIVVADPEPRLSHVREIAVYRTVDRTLTDLLYGRCYAARILDPHDLPDRTAPFSMRDARIFRIEHPHMPSLAYAYGRTPDQCMDRARARYANRKAVRVYALMDTD